MFRIFQTHPKKYQHRINQMLAEDYSLITITAGTGYGKTQTVIHYTEHLDANVVWISLTQLHNYPQHFWKDFTESIRTVSPKLGEYLSYMEFPASQVLLHQFTRIITPEIYAGSPYVIVFDDCHLLSDPSITEFIENLILMDYDNFKVIMISRSAIKFQLLNPLSHRYFHITAEMLNYTKDEIEQFFNDKNMVFNNSTIDVFHHTTGGWPLPVNIARFSLEQNSLSVSDSLNMLKAGLFEILEQRFLQCCKADQHTLTVLSQLDILPLALLNELIREDIVSQEAVSISQESFAQLHPHTNRLRFHKLAAEYLKSKENLVPDELFEAIYRKCGSWYRAHNYQTNALYCFEKIHAYDLMRDTLYSMISSRISAKKAEFIANLFRTFPEAYLKKNPYLEVVYAYSCLMTLDYQKAHTALTDTIKHLQQPPPDAVKELALGEAYLAMALWKMLLGHPDFGHLFKKADQYINGCSSFFNKEFILLNTGNPITLNNGTKGEIDYWIKEVDRSIPYMKKLLKSGYGYHSLVRSQAYYLRGDLKKALDHACQALAEGELEKKIDIVCTASGLINKIHLAEGKYEKAKLALDNMKQFLAAFKPSPSFRLPDTIYSWFYSRLAAFDKISSWIADERIYNHTRLLIAIGEERIITANCLLEQGRYHELLTYLTVTEQIFESRKLFISSITVHVLLAIVYDKLEQPEQAKEQFITVYEMCRPNEIIMPVVEYGPYIRPLLAGIRDRLGGAVPETWLNDLEKSVSVYSRHLNQVRSVYEKKHAETKTYGTLSPREKEILTDMCQGMTREQIADDLSISVNTVKTSLRSIYSKLGALNSTHAANIAITNNLLADHND